MIILSSTAEFKMIFKTPARYSYFLSKKLEGEIVPELVIVPTVVNDFEEVNDVDFTIPVFEPKQEEIELAEDSDDVLEEELSDTDIFADYDGI